MNKYYIIFGFLMIAVLCLVYYQSIYVPAANEQSDIQQRVNDENDSDKLFEENNKVVTAGNDDHNQKEIYEDQPKKREEFTIKSSESDERIALDSRFSELKTESPQIAIENNYVGEIASGFHQYKYFMYKFEDFDLYVSNLKYNEKDRHFDDYYISQITLTTNRYETWRGIKIGMGYDDVVALYGEIEEMSIDSRIGLKYKDSGYEIIFVVSDVNVIESIILSISTNETSDVDTQLANQKEWKPYVKEVLINREDALSDLENLLSLAPDLFAFNHENEEGDYVYYIADETIQSAVYAINPHNGNVYDEISGRILANIFIENAFIEPDHIILYKVIESGVIPLSNDSELISSNYNFGDLVLIRYEYSRDEKIEMMRYRVDPILFEIYDYDKNFIIGSLN